MINFHSLLVKDVRPETRDAIAVTLALPDELRDEFHHVEGQHLTVRATVDGTELRRSYSICSPPGAPDLEIAIKRVQGGSFSNWANDHLRPGDRLEVLAPSGHFQSPDAPLGPRNYLAFAAGSGITPVLSILRHTLFAHPENRFTLVYSNRASSSVMFKEALADLKDRHLARLNIVFVLSREQQDIELFNGRLDDTKVRELMTRWLGGESFDRIFVCGPAGMMESVTGALASLGIGPERVRREVFATSAGTLRPVAPVHRQRGSDLCEVSVIQDGHARSFTMQKGEKSVLDAAIEQGIELPYSCKAGVCSTCRCKRVSGEIDMDVNFALEDYEIARGFILTCQSYPVSDTLTIDYDQTH